MDAEAAQRGLGQPVVLAPAVGHRPAIGDHPLERLDLALGRKLCRSAQHIRLFTKRDEVVIAGFILGVGSVEDAIIVRGIGPSLTQFGVANALADPKLELRDSQGALIASDDNWMDDPNQAAIIQAAGLAPTNSFESAIYKTLAPGPYTALLSGINNVTGTGLVEAYDLAASGPVW